MASDGLVIALEKEILQYQNKLNKISALVEEMHRGIWPSKGGDIDANAVLVSLGKILDELGV
jgi:hypothetical protein